MDGLIQIPTRVERDSMGTVDVPAHHYWGAQTARALQHFAIGDDRMPLDVIRSFGTIKKAAAQANYELGVLPAELYRRIAIAADEVVAGALDDEFPLSIWQSGSGTQTNMNVNEVIANRAIELAGGQLGSKVPVHPNDHVNLSQSSNDTFPSAMHMACCDVLVHRTIPALVALRDALAVKRDAFTNIVKVGRTHLQDAVPLTLGQEFSGYVGQLDADLRHLASGLLALRELPIGGTAVGTGLNAPPGFADICLTHIVEMTGQPYVRASNAFAALAAHDAVVMAHSTLRVSACSLMKIANDLRWAGSGPRAGLGELTLPANEPGSSIMPGKVNPSQCEALTMICLDVFGNDATIGFAGSQGNFELNTFKPLMAYTFLRSATLLADACGSFRTHLVEGLVANTDRIEEQLSRSLMLVTALVPSIGYDRAAEIANKAARDGGSLKAAAASLGYLGEEEFDDLVQPQRMCGPSEPVADPSSPVDESVSG